MAEDTITLALNGRVTLADYDAAIHALTDLVNGLQSEISPNLQTVWEIDDLQISSAIATIRAVSGNPEEVERVTRAYARVGQALAKQEPVPFPARVRQAAKQLTSIIGEDVTSLRFETASEDVTILSPTLAATVQRELEEFGVFGAVIGRIQTVSTRGGIRFTLYDSMFDRAVSCYLTDDSQERIRGLWGTRVAVHGLIKRDSVSGRPVVIRRVSEIEPIVPEEPNRFSYLTARGVIPARDRSEKPEDVLRRFRDAR